MNYTKVKRGSKMVNMRMRTRLAGDIRMKDKVWLMGTSYDDKEEMVDKLMWGATIVFILLGIGINALWFVAAFFFGTAAYMRRGRK